MTRRSELYTFHNIVLAILGPVLLFSIYLTASNALETYVEGERKRQASAWNILQLYKEMRKVHFQSGLYVNDMATKDSLKVAYDILWSRIPTTHSNLVNDEIFISANVNDLELLLTATFEHVQSIEPMITGTAPMDKEELTNWSKVTEQFGNSISMSLMHDLVSVNSEYSKTLRNNVIQSAALLLLSTLAVILYLGYLLFSLWVQRKKHKYLLDHDSLTGLYSRDYTMQLVKRYCDTRTPCTLLTFDINKFKSTNDTLGHQAGDDLLKFLAKCFQKSLCHFGAVGRIGGDEFFCLIESEDLTEINEAYAKFLKLLDKPCSLQGYPVYLRVSTGASLLSQCNFNQNLLLERADAAMYRAKEISFRGIFWSGQPIHGETAEVIDLVQTKAKH